MKLTKYFIFLPLLIALFHAPAQAVGENDTQEKDIQAQLESLKNSASNNNTAKELEDALTFIEKGKKQQQDIANLEKTIKNSPQTIKAAQKEIQQLRDDLAALSNNQFDALNIADLEEKQNALQKKLQNIQLELKDLSTNNRYLLESAHQIINNNEKRLQEIINIISDQDTTKAIRDKLNAETDYLELNSKYNRLITQNNELLVLLNETQRNQAILEQQLAQRQLELLQQSLNSKRLAQSQAHAQQLADLEEQNDTTNPVLKTELDINTSLSKLLLEQTKKLNTLSQDNLRIKNVLDSLSQTKINIEEQISALQGTLVLSRIINQQKQALPTDQLITDLAKDIADLRVMIFELSQRRDELYNLSDYIAKVEHEQKITFTEAEKTTFDKFLQERRDILTDLIKVLNSQLTISNNIESNQRQVSTISDSLQRQLEQQSFWVKSNNPINLAWLEQFPKLAVKEIKELTKYIGFENLNANLIPILIFELLLLAICALIGWKKPAIKQRLSFIASQVNTLKNDRHWYTPEAMLWTIILAIPSTLIFVIIFTLAVYLFFYDPLAGWQEATKVASYWLFFATILSLLRPNGLAYRHFGMPQESNKIFYQITKHSTWIVGLLVVSSIFSEVEIIGFSNDVIGQVMTIVALALCLFVVRPLLNRGIIEYQNAKTEDGTKRNISLFNLLRLVLVIVPMGLIILIVLGYYYTAVYLIQHLLNSYFVALVWVFGRYFAYRSLTISSRRMAYRRLQEKRQKIKEQAAESGKEEAKERAEETIKISTVNQQIFRMADLVGWVALFGSLYAVWSDLISIAYYLDGVILWQHSDGNQLESITLLNIMRSLLYVVGTYMLVKNISGILEVTFFSRMKLAKGTAHTITAVLTYSIVTIGSIISFTSLGISWGKIQWIFTALSVGLGFGVREIFGSFVSGTILLFERPIRVGDKVTVGAYTGIITKIRLRSTTLLDSDNMEVVLPNQAFVTDRFINWTLNNTVTRLKLLINVPYGTNLKTVRQLLMQAANEAPKVMGDPAPEVNIRDFGEHALEHELLVHVPEIGDRTETLNFLYYRIDQLFNERAIRLAFKQLDVHIHNEKTDVFAHSSGQISA